LPNVYTKSFIQILHINYNDSEGINMTIAVDFILPLRYSSTGGQHEGICIYQLDTENALG